MLLVLLLLLSTVSCMPTNTTEDYGGRTAPRTFNTNVLLGYHIIRQKAPSANLTLVGARAQNNVLVDTPEQLTDIRMQYNVPDDFCKAQQDCAFQGEVWKIKSDPWRWGQWQEPTMFEGRKLPFLRYFDPTKTLHLTASEAVARVHKKVPLSRYGYQLEEIWIWGSRGSFSPLESKLPYY